VRSLHRFAHVLAFTLTPLLCSAAPAQSDANGPTALIFSYRAHPGMRAEFRTIMQGEGAAQFESWRKQGVFASFQPLFTSYAGSSAPDMFLVLRFDHFTDLARWQTIEKTHPGGLPLKAQAIADVDTSDTADVLQEKQAGDVGKDTQYFVLEYDLLVDAPRYASYVKGYVAPQFERWIDAGILVGYATYVNQNPAGAPWGSFIVLEYKDLKSLASREIVKTDARNKLAVSDPVWKKWSEDKTAIRKEKAALPALSLTVR
jgi:hypothetical protein